VPMNPFDRFSSSHFFRASSSILDREYIGPNSGVNPCLMGIRWSYGRWGGSLLASPLENNGRNLWYSGGIMSEISFVSLLWSSTLLISYSDIAWTCS
jgi:hypothetical protein